MQLQITAVVLVSLFLSSCSITKESPSEYWELFKDKEISSSQLSNGEGLLVFYRQPNTVGDAIDIYVNSDYQTSLVNGGISAIKLCAKQNFISTSYTSNQNFGNRTSGINFYIPSKQITYIKVTSNDGKNPYFKFITNEQAQHELEQLKYQSNVLSRVIEQDCQADNYVISTYQVPFSFDHYSSNSLSPLQQQQLADFISKLKQSNHQISYVTVDGYSDPVGKASYNQKLSERRSHTVSTILQQSNLGVNINSQGLGETNLLVNDCEQQYQGHKPLIKQCNAVNRRVDIAVFGSN